MPEHPSIQQHPWLFPPDGMVAPSCLEEEVVAAAAAAAVVVGALLPASESCRSCSYLSRSSLATDSVVTEAFQSSERRRVIVSIVSEGQEKTAVVFEVACHHSLETPGWETERRREAKTPEGIAVGAEFAPL